MEPKKHKRKLNHVVIVTSDAVDAGVKQFRFSPWVIRTIIGVLCVIIGVLLAYVSHEQKIWENTTVKIGEYREEIENLQAALSQKDVDAEAERASWETEKNNLQTEIDELNAKMEIMSQTINQKVEIEKEMAAFIDALSTPTLLPLSGSASIEEQEGDNPMCIFTASEGALVVSTAEGTVFTLVEDSEYGYNLTIDHGNGYQTVYRNKGKTLVKVGDTVKQNQALFIIGEDNKTLGYQMLKDGVYVNPTDIMEISG